MNVKLVAITEKAEELIEFAARVCYQSMDKMQTGTAEKLIHRLLTSGHESPLEHAYATFYLTGFSRAMTHQLVRHRLMAVSQQSQRYVSESNFDYVVPPSIAPTDADDFRADMDAIRSMYAKWKGRGLRNEDARFVLPNACATDVVISANFREFRHIFQVRCAPQAQWEIRKACDEMLRQLHAKAPTVFSDLIPLLTESPVKP